MNRTALIVTIMALGLFAVLFPEQSYLQEKPLAWEVYFSPRGGSAIAIINQLDQAKTTILIQAYFFTSEPIAKALLGAYKRGVNIRVILDRKQRTDQYSMATFLFNQGISVKIDSRHAANHNKVMIIDEKIVITGSFNFTPKAENQNAENLLVIRDGKLASLYLKDFQKHSQHSEFYRTPFK